MKRSVSTASEMNDFTEVDGQKIYRVSKSRLISLISWVQVFGLYLPIIWFGVVGLLLYQLFIVFYESRFDFYVRTY